jgi:hypothetical protein
MAIPLAANYLAKEVPWTPLEAAPSFSLILFAQFGLNTLENYFEQNPGSLGTESHCSLLPGDRVTLTSTPWD